MMGGVVLVGGRLTSECRVATACVVEGTVTSPGGTPVKEALVLVYPPIMGRGEAPGTASTDNEGRFRLTLEHPGEHLVSVDAQGFAPSSGIRARPGVPLAVRLEKGRTIEGLVRDGVTGRPIGGALVTSPGFRLLPATPPRAGRREAVTNASGRYRLEQVPTRAAVIYAAAKGYTRGPAPLSLTATRADLTLQAGVWLSGTGRSTRGAAVKGAVVTAIGFE